MKQKTKQKEKLTLNQLKEKLEKLQSSHGRNPTIEAAFRNELNMKPVVLTNKKVYQRQPKHIKSY